MSIWNRPHVRRIIGAVVSCHFLLTTVAQDLGAGQFKERRAPSRTDLRPPPVLFLLPDSHCQYSTQKDTRDILTRLWSARMIRAVFLEGNSGNIDTTLFSSLPSEPIKKDVIDDFMKKGLMTGAEGFAIENASSLPLVGIEDPALYAKSLCLLQRAFRNQAATRFKTTLLEEWLGRQEKSQFNPNLREFKNADLTLGALKAWADKTHVLLDRFPTLFACLRALETGRTGAPGDIDVFSLSDDVEAAREKIENSLARKPREKELLLVERYINLLTHLCLAEITPFEMERYRRIRGGWPSIEQTVRRRDPAMASTLRDLDGERKAMEEFYALAHDRDLAMTRNMERFLAGKENAACIAGGYHATSLQRLAQTKGVHTVILLPDVSGPSGREIYAGLLKSQSNTLALPSYLGTEQFRKRFLSASVRLFWKKLENEQLPLNEKVQRLSLFLREWKQAYRKKSSDHFPFSLRMVRFRNHVVELVLEAKPHLFLVRIRNRGTGTKNPPSPKWPKNVRALLAAQCLMGLSFHASFFMVHLLNEGYALSSLARYFAFFSPAYLAGSVLLAVMVGRWGKKRILVASFILNATGTVCLAFAGLSPAILAVSQALGALALAGYSVTLNSLLYETLNRGGQGESFKRVYGRALQWFWIWMALSSLLGGWMVSLVPFWGVILASALVSLGLAGLIWACVPKEEPERETSRLTFDLSFIRTIRTVYATTGKQVFFNKKLRGLIFLSLFINGVFLASVDFLAQPLLKDLDLPLFLFGCLSVASNLTHAMSSRYADKLESLILRPGPRTAYFLMMLILLAGFITGDSLLFLTAFLFAANFWQGLLFIVGPAQIHTNLKDEHRSCWCSLWNILSAGTSVLSFIFLSELLSWMSAPSALVVLLLSAIAASALISLPHHRQTGPDKQ